MPPDPYAVLGISPRTPLAGAEDAYHRLLRQEHPDLHHRAGPERVADAERRTRELNAAISTIRDAATADATAHLLGASAPAASRGPTRRRGPGRDAGDARPSAPGEAGPAGSEPPATAPCPWCGAPFGRAAELKDHVHAAHDVRLDRRVRGGLFGGRIHRTVQAAARLPLWAVLPVNALVAAIVASAVIVVTNETVGWWAFAVVMSPSAATLLDRAFDATR